MRRCLFPCRSSNGFFPVLPLNQNVLEWSIVLNLLGVMGWCHRGARINSQSRMCVEGEQSVFPNFEGLMLHFPLSVTRTSGSLVSGMYIRLFSIWGKIPKALTPKFVKLKQFCFAAYLVRDSMYESVEDIMCCHKNLRTIVLSSHYSAHSRSTWFLLVQY